MKFSIRVEDRHREKAASLSLSECLGYLCCPDYGAHNRQRRMLDTAAAFIHRGDSSFHRALIGELRDACREKPLVCSDFEAGPGTMITDGTQFPSFFACSVADDPSLTYEMGKIAALEGGNLGYGWTLGPAVDICANPDTPTTGNRGAGISAEEAVVHGLAYIKGCQENGMVATAKHFPGDGFGIYDQHLTTPEIPLTAEEWRNSSGKVYRAMIEGGVMSIMPGHISFPACDDVWEGNGVYPPATLSERLMKGLLKDELGFEGLIISDAVKMGGFAGFMNYYDACARFLEWGGDLLLFAYPDAKFTAAMERRIEAGILTEDTLRDRTARLMAFKEQVNELSAGKMKPIDNGEHQQTAKRVIEGSLTVIRDRKSLLPVRNGLAKNVLHVVINSPGFERDELMESFTGELKTRFLSVEQWNDPGNSRIIEAVEGERFDLIICSVLNGYSFGTNVIRLHGYQARNLMGGWMHRGTPVVFISHCHPFLHREYGALMDTVINTHGTVEGTMPFLADLICGK